MRIAFESRRTQDNHSSKGKPSCAVPPRAVPAARPATPDAVSTLIKCWPVSRSSSDAAAHPPPARRPADPCCRGCSGAEQACWPVPFDSGQNGTPERCASRTAVAHRASQPSRSPTGSLPGGGPASGGAGVAVVVSGWAGRGMSITFGMSFSDGPTGSTQWGHAPHAGDASGQRPGQCRSSTDSNVTVSRHTRYGGRAVRAVVDIPIVHHKAEQLSNAPGVDRPSSGPFRTMRAGAATPHRHLIGFHDVFMIAVVRPSLPGS